MDTIETAISTHQHVVRSVWVLENNVDYMTKKVIKRKLHRYDTPPPQDFLFGVGKLTGGALTESLAPAPCSAVKLNSGFFFRHN